MKKSELRNIIKEELSLITEGKNLKFDIDKVKINFLVIGFSNSNVISFTPKTLKDLDLIEGTGLSNTEIEKKLIEYAGQKTKLKFEHARGSDGYNISVVMDSIISKL